MSSIIARKAVIASFDSGQPRFRKAHRDETAALNAKHGTSNLALVTVTICDHPALAEAGRIITAARADHYRLTVPAADRGMRLLPGARQLEHSSLLQGHAVKFQSAVADFVREYDTIRADAPARLNGLYVPEQWPDVDFVRNAFRLRCRYLPVPSLGQWDEWLAESASTATDELRERIGEALRAYAAKLGDGGKIFRDSLVENLRDIVNLAEDLNVGGDKTVADLVAKARDLAQPDPDQLREDPALRADTAARAADLCSLFSL
jgi:hypothetical protein